MKKMMRSLKKNRKKGFTLVELIVVLVILAILAALLIPALTGYIDKAKEKQIIAETRQVVMAAKKKQVVAETRACVIAAQTLADEQYAQGNDLNDTNVPPTDVRDLAEVKATPKISYSGGKVSVLEYEDGGLTCTYKVSVK